LIFSFELGILVLALDFQTLVLANEFVTLVLAIKSWISIATSKNGKKNHVFFGPFFKVALGKVFSIII